jgi:hypothetical protein
MRCKGLGEEIERAPRANRLDILTDPGIQNCSVDGRWRSWRSYGPQRMARTWSWTLGHPSL